jgi:Rps23 Pro-64 3,4-dihydroxylase Tpa1-like proline 4-hydroxylase
MNSALETFDFTHSLLPLDKMEEIVATRAQEYQNAQPYPHIVMDDFFDEAILERVLDEFPGTQGEEWRRFQSENEVKLASQQERGISLFTRYLIYLLNSSTFLGFLERLTGIPDLISDPHLYGGGLHQIVPGGLLKVHVDFNTHRKFKLDRRLNLLVYLNKDWHEEYGGHFELWDKDMTHCVKKVLPVFNRVVVFSTSEISYHGHPDPLRCPEDRTRKSLALYYYSNGRPDAASGAQAHSTLFRDRPGGEGGRGKALLKKLVPPLFVELGAKLRGGR